MIATVLPINVAFWSHSNLETASNAVRDGHADGMVGKAKLPAMARDS
jgi:hypothetical protein